MCNRREEHFFRYRLHRQVRPADFRRTRLYALLKFRASQLRLLSTFDGAAPVECERQGIC